MKHVIACMRALCPISDETVKELESLVVKCNYPKRYQLIKENIFCRYAYFIEKGMTRSFWLVDGEEITTSFSCEGGIVFSMDELYYNKKSEEFVETLEDVEVYRIELTDLRRLFETNLEFCNWGRIIHQNEYRRLHRAAVGAAELAPPGPALFFDYFEHSFSLNRQTSVLPDASYFTGPIIANPAEYFNSPVFGRESAKKCAALLTRRSQRIIVKLMNIS